MGPRIASCGTPIYRLRVFDLYYTTCLSKHGTVRPKRNAYI